MVDLLCALHLGRLVREALRDGEGEVEAAPLVHAFVGLDSQSEVKRVIWVREFRLHRIGELEL